MSMKQAVVNAYAVTAKNAFMMAHADARMDALTDVMTMHPANLANVEKMNGAKTRLRNVKMTPTAQVHANALGAAMPAAMRTVHANALKIVSSDATKTVHANPSTI